jgi:hypothetical protein
MEATGAIPQIQGTGFVVDGRGIVLTAGHVARLLQKVPRHPITGEHGAAAILFSEPTREGGELAARPLWVKIKSYSFLESFTTESGIFYGERLPDLAFLQLSVRDVPALSFVSTPNVIRTGRPIAFAGYPFGSRGLVLRLEDQEPILLQMTPFLRQGIISSVHPFPCPEPHGFTIDAMSHGGASGSPIFGQESPGVLGMLYAGFEGENRLTYALPGSLLKWATDTAVSDASFNISGVPTAEEYRAACTSPEGWVFSTPEPRA